MRITQSQLRQIIKEELEFVLQGSKSEPLLSEAQLNEIAPIVGAAVRALGPAAGKILTKALPIMKKGGIEAAKFLLTQPALLEKFADLIITGAEKVPGLSAVIKDRETLVQALQDDGMAAKVGNMMAQLSGPLASASAA